MQQGKMCEKSKILQKYNQVSVLKTEGWNVGK